MKLLCFIVLFVGLTHHVSGQSECTARGRFPNNDGENCRGYTMCLLGGAAGFTQYKLNCPVTFVYSHLEQQCTNATNYECLPTYQCNTTGLFENELSKNCSSYIACPEGISGLVTARLVECPTGQVFNPTIAACVDHLSYECPASVVKTEVTESPQIIVMPNITSFNISIISDDSFQLAGSASASSTDIRGNIMATMTLLMFTVFYK